ncbi:hypothetical protein [Streptomyces sp. HNM0574]|uniref:hypothetical protein n=1 Tax=Streptomyces sp. HNM0574 TaxID=2714954 RepID=UPI00146C0B77|nr:hypothetical protein [Streptomyces sp. HNM0574]NLU67284.1 hypothetical protein [Streptomyces sp. HNM0574]
MIWEALGSVVLGLAVAYAAAARLPGRFPNQALVFATGPVAALLGGIVTRVVLGPGHTALTLVAAAAVSVALLSLLLSENVRSPGLPPTADIPGTPPV